MMAWIFVVREGIERPIARASGALSASRRTVRFGRAVDGLTLARIRVRERFKHVAKSPASSHHPTSEPLQMVVGGPTPTAYNVRNGVLLAQVSPIACQLGPGFWLSSPPSAIMFPVISQVAAWPLGFCQRMFE
jgi:hypothetical protein